MASSVRFELRLIGLVEKLHDSGYCLFVERYNAICRRTVCCTVMLDQQSEVSRVCDKCNVACYLAAASPRVEAASAIESSTFDTVFSVE